MIDSMVEGTVGYGMGRQVQGRGLPPFRKRIQGRGQTARGPGFVNGSPEESLHRGRTRRGCPLPVCYPTLGLFRISTSGSGKHRLSP